MVPTFCIHLERTDEGPSWWATSEDLPGFSAAAGTLADLRARIRAVLIEDEAGEGSFREILAGQQDADRHRIAVSV